MKYIPIFYISLVMATTNPEFYGSFVLDIEQIIEQSRAYISYTTSFHHKSSTVLSVLKDEKNLVLTDFKISDYFKDSTHFWFSIYTAYSSKSVIIHDKKNLALIYRVLNFEELHNSDLNIFTKYKIQNQLAEQNVDQIKATLRDLSLGKSSAATILLLKNLHNQGLRVPTNAQAKKAFFSKLSNNIRTQTGQKNMISKGILNFETYREYLEYMVKKFGLPDEIIAIAFLESSFNLNAVSKAGASGIWQFMPYIANIFMPKIGPNLDYRSNPVISSLAAFHLIKRNKKLLKKWDLTIPAYNSGTKHIINARRKFPKAQDFNLEFMLRNYDHPHVGFASQNFYSEFLALVHALKYKNTFFNITGSSISSDFKSNDIKVYISRCNFKLPALAKKYGKSLYSLNPQFKHQIKYKPGKILVSDITLPAQYFQSISQDTLVNSYPKDWIKSKNFKNCSLL